MAAAFRFVPVPLDAGAAPLLIAGPPGAGKTLTVARLASRLVMRGAAPLVITVDGQRAGATEQLAAFTRLLGVDLIVAGTPKLLKRALTRRVADAPVLIDAPGVDAHDDGQQRVLQELATSAAATIALVLPAGLDPAEAEEIAAAYRQNMTTLLIANRLDGARRLGGVLSAASIGLSLTEAGIGAGVADGLVPLTPEFLAARLMQFPDAHA
jgi:flagellar biosynthesis protein FlhF